jgi:SmpB protein
VARAKQIQEKRAQKRVDASGGDRVVATNRRARYDYEIIETLECGIMLSGSEVKSLREGKAQIAESYARFDDTEFGCIRCTYHRGSTRPVSAVTTPIAVANSWRTAANWTSGNTRLVPNR